MARLLAPMDAMFLHLESPSMLAHVTGLQIFSPPHEAAPDFTGRLVAELRRTRDLAPPSVLNVPIGGEPRFATQQLDITRIKTVGRASDATINYVMFVDELPLRDYRLPHLQ